MTRHALIPLFMAPLLTQASTPSTPGGLPFVINTWGGPFTIATDTAYNLLLRNPPPSDSSTAYISALDAVEQGCAACERNQCDGTVGHGGSPDEHCETTLDAMIMDGTTMRSGAVAGLRRVRHAIAAARLVLEHTTHTMLAGDLATLFALQNGLPEEDLGTPESLARCASWRDEDRCQPNYRVNVLPDPEESCGPYTPVSRSGQQLPLDTRRQASHDTISQVVIHRDGTMAAGTSTNGASHKVPGRVGDGAITGSGSYVDGEVGGCGATGDGDIMMRFLPCYQAVENMRRGMSPTEAAEDAVARMVSKYPGVSSGLVVVDRDGRHGGAASGWTFTYSYRGGDMEETKVVTVEPIEVERRSEL